MQVSNDSCMKCKVVMLGSASAGKTSIINRQVYSTFSHNVKPTLGAGLAATTISVESNPLLPKKTDFQSHQLFSTASDPNILKTSFQNSNDKIDVTLNLWNTAGQESYRSLARVYYRDSQAAIIVFDITNRDSFKEADFWLNELQSCSLHDKCLLFIVGNKIDLIETDKENQTNEDQESNEQHEIHERKVSIEEAQSLARQNKGFYFETSAKTGKGVEELFESVAKRFVVNQRNTMNPNPSSPSLISKRRYDDSDNPNSKIINIVDNDEYNEQQNKNNSDCCS